MTNQLLEQWRKEAEGLYNTFDIASQRAYVEGCKATHEKMQKEIQRLKELNDTTYQAAYRQGFDDGKRKQRI